MTEARKTIYVGETGIVLATPAEGRTEYRRADQPPKVKNLGNAATIKTPFGVYYIEKQEHEHVLFSFHPRQKSERHGS